MVDKKNVLNDAEALPEAKVAKPDQVATQSVSVAVRLQPVEHSQQPVFSNFTTVQSGTGVVFIDFGFVEPQTMANLARLGQPGVTAPEAIAGTLACRMALSLDTTANLANQLNRLLRNSAAVQAQVAQPAQEAAQGPLEDAAAGPVN